MTGKDLATVIKRIEMHISQADSYFRQGKLLKANNILQKAACMLLSRLKSNPKHKTLLELKNKHERCRNKIIHAMIASISPNQHI